MTEGSSKRPRGFGFVTFEDPTSVAILTRSRYHPIDNRLVEVKAAVPREMMHTVTEADSAALPGVYPATGDYGADGSSAAGGSTLGVNGDWYNQAYPNSVVTYGG